ncbi:MAG: TIGR00701 family protein [Rhodospirillaceae bacterium]|nr:TIGR00701 family protein [Rhodospirillaceae bacterium]
MAEYYLWFKALHMFAVIAWMAGIFYLPRLYVYHADAEPGSDKSETFKIMERRLLRAIVNPSMILTFVFGALMVSASDMVDWQQGWPWVKLVMILLLLFIHFLFARWRRDFAADRNIRSAKFYRWWNEAPTIPLIVIIIMAVVKPF